MALLTRDPAMLRRAGWLFALAVPASLFLAYDLREDKPGGAVFTFVLALLFGLISAWSLRRAGTSREQPAVPGKQNHEAVLAVAAVGWVAFGVFYGLMQDNVVAFVVSLIAAGMSAGAAAYLWRDVQLGRSASAGVLRTPGRT